MSASPPRVLIIGAGSRGRGYAQAVVEGSNGVVAAVAEPDEYKRLAGDPLTVTARVVADRIGGELLEVPGFYPHVQQPERVNEALEELWSRADAR